FIGCCRIYIHVSLATIEADENMRVGIRQFLGAVAAMALALHTVAWALSLRPSLHRSIHSQSSATTTRRRGGPRVRPKPACTDSRLRPLQPLQCVCAALAARHCDRRLRHAGPGISSATHR